MSKSNRTLDELESLVERQERQAERLLGISGSFTFVMDEEEIAVSTRSACAAGALQASHVLLSIGREFADAQGTLVVTFGEDNTKEHVVRFLTVLKDAVKTLREISPLYRKSAS